MTAAATTAATLATLAALMSHPVAATLLALLPGIVLVLLGLALIACLSRANGEAGSDCPSADQLWESDPFFDLIDHDRPPRRTRP